MGLFVSVTWISWSSSSEVTGVYQWNLWNFLFIDFWLESYLDTDKGKHFLSIHIESLVLWDVLSFGALALWIIQCFGTFSDGGRSVMGRFMMRSFVLWGLWWEFRPVMGRFMIGRFVTGSFCDGLFRNGTFCICNVMPAKLVFSSTRSSC
jgi:hypothetical protein